MSWFTPPSPYLKNDLDVTRQALALEQSARERLEREHAILQAQFEWLTTHVNRLEAERQVLLERVMGLTLPSPTFEYRRGASPVVSSPPNKLSDANTPPQNVPLTDEYATSIPALQVLGSTFEDVGDEQASALGISHGPAGDLQYRR